MALYYEDLSEGQTDRPYRSVGLVQWLRHSNARYKRLAVSGTNLSRRHTALRDGDRLTSKEDRGLVDRKLSLINQRGEVVQEGYIGIMLRLKQSEKVPV